MTSSVSQSKLWVVLQHQQTCGTIVAVRTTSSESAISLLSRLSNMYYAGGWLRQLTLALHTYVYSQQLAVSLADLADVRRWPSLGGDYTDGSQIIVIDAESGPRRESRVFVPRTMCDELLTAAFEDPSILSASTTLTQLYPGLVFWPERHPPTHAIVLSLRFSGAKAVKAITSTVLASAVLGTVFGVGLHSLEVGLNIFASFTGMMAVLQGCMMWAGRQ